MIISRAPYRVSLFGGSSDYRSYYRTHSSVLVGFTIDKYVYTTIRKNQNLYDYKSKISYSIIENVKEHSDIQNNGVKGVLQHFNLNDGISICIMADVPQATGLGGSASLVVALTKAVDYYMNNQSTLSKDKLARESIYITRDLLKERGGIQDEVWAAYGGVNSISLHQDDSIIVRPLHVSGPFLDRLRDRIVIAYTGRNRNTYSLAGQHDNTSGDVVGIKHRLVALAKDALVAFEYEDIEHLGTLLENAWKLKKSIATGISDDYIDGLYTKGINNGALSAKLLGSGGSGFMLYLLDKNVDKNEFTSNIGLECIDWNYSYGGAEVVLT